MCSSRTKLKVICKEHTVTVNQNHTPSVFTPHPASYSVIPNSQPSTITKGKAHSMETSCNESKHTNPCQVSCKDCVPVRAKQLSF